LKKELIDFRNLLAENMEFRDAEAGTNSDADLVNLVIRPMSMTEDVD